MVTAISYTHRVILLKTRKTAGTSVELWLSSIAGPRDVFTPLDPGDEALRDSVGGRIQHTEVPRYRYRPIDFARELRNGRVNFVSHMPAHELRQYVGERVWNSFLKVTVERDPYERAVSMYRFKTRSMIEPPSLIDFLRRFPATKLANAPIYTIEGRVVADVVLDYSTLSSDVAALQNFSVSRRLPCRELKCSGPPRAAASDCSEKRGDDWWTAFVSTMLGSNYLRSEWENSIDESGRDRSIDGAGRVCLGDLGRIP